MAGAHPLSVPGAQASSAAAPCWGTGWAHLAPARIPHCHSIRLWGGHTVLAGARWDWLGAQPIARYPLTPHRRMWRACSEGLLSEGTPPIGDVCLAYGLAAWMRWGGVGWLKRNQLQPGLVQDKVLACARCDTVQYRGCSSACAGRELLSSFLPSFITLIACSCASVLINTEANSVVH